MIGTRSWNEDYFGAEPGLVVEVRPYTVEVPLPCCLKCRGKAEEWEEFETYESYEEAYEAWEFFDGAGWAVRITNGNGEVCHGGNS